LINLTQEKLTLNLGFFLRFFENRAPDVDSAHRQLIHVVHTLTLVALPRFCNPQD